jgi:hypothetical protein
MSRRVLIGWVLAAAILAALVVHERQTRPKHAPAPVRTAAKTYQQLVAVNYRTLTPKPIPPTIRKATATCGDRLGGPPPGSSLQTTRWHSGLLVLYLPKQCLLDPTVTSG